MSLRGSGLPAMPRPRVRARLGYGEQWRLGGNTYRGPMLTVIWVIEALILVLGCTLIASHVGKPGVICPACRKRCARRPGSLGRFDGSDTSNVAERLKAGDFDYLLELGPVRHEDDPEVALELLTCPCGQTDVLNASRIAWEVNSQGGAGVKIRPLLEGLLITPEQVEHVRGLKDRLPPLENLNEGDETSPDDDAAARSDDDDDERAGTADEGEDRTDHSPAERPPHRPA